MIYRLPQIKDEKLINDYIQEHYEQGEKSISASYGLTSSEYKQWVAKINRNAVEGDERFGKSLLLLCFDNKRLIGPLTYATSCPELSWTIGHRIWRPSIERNKGYATAMLKHA